MLLGSPKALVFGCLVDQTDSLKLLGQPLALKSLITRRSLLCLCAVVNGMHLARFIKVLTTDLLSFAGLCKWKCKILDSM